ncbi:MAG: Transcriptional regulator, GntR family domain / Aspartate aminotransferase [uncultured Gemmatimonadetes bacterium]|uniref:Transcriptional regulator, GntR family domain / Aspartate aminotransferase n=1 Tax=uncultured Gemmatimonadota bacterium TaxID=203437 RepID=A0A6J4LLT2_9BACT|nr:MAG: Transcriptional regulator, GntR family domain / Aspartate aminotransferase [uncultured Gemmatimonadota bacterium]
MSVETLEAAGAALPRLAEWARAARPSALQSMLTRASRPGVVSLALGFPAPELFPREEVGRAAERALAAEPLALQYTPPLARLRAQVAELMARREVSCSPEQVFLTAGAQQGMSLLTRLLLEPGGSVVAERLAYTGFLQVIEPFRPRVVTVPTDLDEGMDVDALERLLAGGERPALIYAVPQGHNPLTVTMSAARRERLVALAREHEVPVLEDDAYGFLQYGPGAPPPLRALDDRWVFYVGSFSKILAPGLRQGWVVVPEAFVPKLAIVKESSDINTATFSQYVLTAFLEEGGLPAHVARLCAEYRARRDAMVQMLEEHFPAGTRWRVPESGIFLWVELPRGVDAMRLLQVAVDEEDVVFIPGSAFAVEGDGGAAECIRLNFSHSPPERIREGMLRLARAVARVQRRGTASAAE